MAGKGLALTIEGIIKGGDSLGAFRDLLCTVTLYASLPVAGRKQE